MSLVKVYLDTAGGTRRNREIHPERLLNLPDVIRNNVASAMKTMGEQVLEEIRFGYMKAIRVRPRHEGQHLMERLRQAMSFSVSTPKREVWLGVFELGVMDRLTRNEGRGTESRGWFLNLEDGHGDTPKHGSKQFAFVELERAQELASEASDNMKLSPEDRAKFLANVADRFQGRHGNGIMVNLDEPLFYDYPRYGHDPGDDGGRGKARNIIGDYGHHGYPALDVLSKVGRGWTQNMKDLAVRAVNDAAKTL